LPASFLWKLMDFEYFVNAVFPALVICLGVALGCWAGYVATPYGYGRWLRWRLDRRVRRAGVLVLTFDDGPGAVLTPRLLEILEERQVRAGFFLLGRHVARREALVREIRQAGHDICSHGFDHVRQSRALPRRTVADIRNGWAAIDGALGDAGGGRGVYPFRPPHGRLNAAGLAWLWWKRVPIVYWTIDSGDTWARDRRDSGWAARELSRRGGGVVLLHDFDRTEERTGTMVLESVERLLETASEMGIRVVPVRELLDGVGQMVEAG